MSLYLCCCAALPGKNRFCEEKFVFIFSKKSLLKIMRPFATLAWRRTACLTKWDRRSCHTSPAPGSRLPNILYSQFEDVPLSKQPYFDFLWMNHKKNGDRIALVSYESKLKFRPSSVILNCRDLEAFPWWTCNVFEFWKLKISKKIHHDQVVIC